MNDASYPNLVGFEAAHDAIRGDHNLAACCVADLGNDAAGFRKAGEAVGGFHKPGDKKGRIVRGVPGNVLGNGFNVCPGAPGPPAPTLLEPFLKPLPDFLVRHALALTYLALAVLKLRADVEGVNDVVHAGIVGHGVGDVPCGFLGDHDLVPLIRLRRKNGRGDWIRTSDLLHPMQAR